MKGEENLKIFNSVAPAQTKNEDLPFDISWMTDWIVDWFGSLFNGGSDVIKDGVVHASVPAFFDVIFLILSVVILISLLVFGASLWFKHIKWKKRSIYFGVGSFILILLIRILPVLMLTTRSFDFQTFMSNMVGLITSIILGTAVLMFLISLALGMLYKKLEHPKYGKWSSSLRYSSIFIFVMTLLVPALLRHL
ncbi:MULTISPECIES: hypothetical protein [unclassified Bacillus (in: firmicutes)]|uniref:hypothetical protein n=1 Tax=unclassified Bacillus (in: firmicutes) TaxID=185979 RepID=UPI003010455C